ncbi:hypothetical protein, partial [Salipiger aestuarii]|uniref:hypothetical protein n=1 Tax=Salipiger aestuarii TaxID=568098 RepID=UPI001238E139
MLDHLHEHIASDRQARYRAGEDSRFVSLWDMLQLQTETFLPALTLLASAVGDLIATRNIMAIRPDARSTMPMLTRAHILKSVEIIVSTAERHDLRITLSSANRCKQVCERILSVPGPMDVSAINALIGALEGLVQVVIDEAESRRFYALGPRVNVQQQSVEDLFGAEVMDAFPSATFDLEEAGRCLTFELWTAAVMHLMRGLEPALEALALHAGVAAGSNWNQTLDQIEKALRQLSKREHGAAAEEWAAEAGVQLRFIKNAWRNSAMHGGVIYDERRARGIFE